MLEFGVVAYTKYHGGGVRVEKEVGAAAWRGGAHVWSEGMARDHIM